MKWELSGRTVGKDARTPRHACRWPVDVQFTGLCRGCVIILKRSVLCSTFCRILLLDTENPFAPNVAHPKEPIWFCGMNRKYSP